MRKKLPTQNWTKKKRKRKRPLPCRRLTFSSSFPSRHRPLVTASPLGGALWRVKYDNTIRNKQRNIKKEEEKGKNRAKKIVVGVINTFVGRTMPSALKWLKQVGPTKTLQRLYFPSFLFLFSQLFCFTSPEQQKLLLLLFLIFWWIRNIIIETNKQKLLKKQNHKQVTNNKGKIQKKKGDQMRDECVNKTTHKKSQTLIWEKLRSVYELLEIF